MKEAHLIIIFFLFFISFNVFAQWYSPDWQYRQQITISSAVADSNLTNFPVLIAIDDANNPIFNHAQADGDDILFTASDGVTKLSHEIERYNPLIGNKELKAWVKIPNLLSNTNTIIYIYYGNPNALNQQNPTDVWDSNFVMVHHLEETSGTIYDSTQYHNNGVPENGPNLNVDGKINGADYFDGSNDLIRVNHSSSLAVNRLTMEAWIYRNNNCPLHQDTCMILNKEYDYEYGIRDGNTLQWAIRTTTYGIWFWVNTGITIPQNTWNYVVVTYDGSAVRTYRNGQLVHTYSYSGNITNHSDCLKISGRNGCSSLVHSPFPGYIDEVRLSNIARSSAWISATYRITNSPSSYLTFGSEEIYITPTPTITSTPTISPTPTNTPTPPPLPLFNSLSIFMLILIISILFFTNRRIKN